MPALVRVCNACLTTSARLLRPPYPALLQVHVFELTIRAVGGLLSAHMLIEQVGVGLSGSLSPTALGSMPGFVPGCRCLRDVSLAARLLSRAHRGSRRGCVCTARTSARPASQRALTPASTPLLPHRTPSWCPAMTAPCCAWLWT